MRLIRLNTAMSRHEWLLILALTGLFLIGAFIRFPDSAYRGLILTTFNFLHFPAFFVLYFIIARALRFPAQLGKFGPILTTISIAMLLELVQPLLHRSATWIDVFVSSAGALTAFWLIRLKTRWYYAGKQRAYWVEAACFLLAFSLCCFKLLKPVYSATYILAAKHSAFPELSAHRAPLGYLNWFPLPEGTQQTAKLKIVTCPTFSEPSRSEASSSGSSRNSTPTPPPEQCVAVKPVQKSWSGLAQILGFDSWEKYDSLELEILSEKKGSLILRIDDTDSGPNYGDRFNRQILLQQGLTRVSIPLTALKQLPKRMPLRLNKIRKLYLFIAPTETPEPFYLRRIFLRHAK